MVASWLGGTSPAPIPERCGPVGAELSRNAPAEGNEMSDHRDDSPELGTAVLQRLPLERAQRCGPDPPHGPRHTPCRVSGTRRAPVSVAEPHGWEVATYLRPHQGTGSGGDVLAVVPLRQGKLAVVVGDVMGHGPAAAGTARLMRLAAQRLVTRNVEPADILDCLDAELARLAPDQIMTLLVCIIDTWHEELRLANAGHPPVIIVHEDGTAEQNLSSSGLILGAGGGVRETITLPFGASDTLLAFTDGVFERRGEDIDRSQERLLSASARLREAPMPAGLQTLVDGVHSDNEDDTTAVVVRRRSSHGQSALLAG